jgi:hypothetical protein
VRCAKSGDQFKRDLDSKRGTCPAGPGPASDLVRHQPQQVDGHWRLAGEPAGALLTRRLKLAQRKSPSCFVAITAALLVRSGRRAFMSRTTGSARAGRGSAPMVSTASWSGRPSRQRRVWIASPPPGVGGSVMKAGHQRPLATGSIRAGQHGAPNSARGNSRSHRLDAAPVSALPANSAEPCLQALPSCPARRW